MPLAAPKYRNAGYRTPQQRKEAVESHRSSSVERGYDGAWYRLRHAYLLEHPFCECDEHRGKLVPAHVVDHREPIATHPHLRLEWTNLRAMAKRCHDRHTALTQGFARKR